MQNYLFVHFRETTSPEGEQVYFALSRDGFNWHSLNDAKPILWAYQGDHGVRDMTVIRDRNTGKFHIFATDLSLSYGMRTKYKHSWANISRFGSKALAHWESENLTDWTEEELITLGDERLGCLWAPDVIYDRKRGDYVLHWSSSRASNDFGYKGIYYSRTADFRHFSEPALLFDKPDGSVIDSAMYEEDGKYYLFVKSENNPKNIALLRADEPTGKFEYVPAFDEAVRDIDGGFYEAPTAVKLDDGRWCLFLDYYGVPGAGQGYVPYVASSLAKADFRRSDSAFHFPYGFKHGTILTITPEEYERMESYDWGQWKEGRW